MKTYNIFTNQEDTLPLGKADFLFLTSSSDDERTQQDQINASEFLLHGTFTTQPSSLTNPYAPLNISRAVHTLCGFSALEILEIDPKRSAKDAKEIFGMGMELGKSYDLRGAYLILCANATPYINQNREKIVSLADQTKRFELLSSKENAIELFCAGFLMQASRRFHIVLAQEVQMLNALLLADMLREDVLMRLKDANITLITPEISAEFSLLSYIPHCVWSDCNFEDIQSAQNINQHFGANAALAYAQNAAINKQNLLEEMEYIFYSL